MNYLIAVAIRSKRLQHVSEGVIASCSTCQSDYGMDESELEESIEQGRIVNEYQFYKAPCDGCGQSTPGDRCDGHAIDPSDNSLNHVLLCPDCVRYFANGELPESWP